MTVSIEKFFNGGLSSVVLYCAILVADYGLESRPRLARALNAVAGLVRAQRNDDAVNMIAKLSTFLRRTLDGAHRRDVPLREELSFVDDYLEIAKLRFADRLTFDLDVPHEFDDVPAPHLILQPLVENAIKHGIAKRAQGGSIRISAAGADGVLRVSVTNDAPSAGVQSDAERIGAGIANVRTRLRNLYGGAFDVTIRPLTDGTVEVSLTVPLRAGMAPA